MEIKEVDHGKELGEAALNNVAFVAPSSVQKPKFSSNVLCQLVKGSKFCHHQGTIDDYYVTLNSIKMSLDEISSLFV